MLYGFSGLGAARTSPTTTSTVASRPSGMTWLAQTQVTLPPWTLAAGRLKSKLIAYGQNDPQGICGEGELFAGSCAQVYVKNALSAWQKAFVSELNALKTQGHAATSMMLYQVADMVSQHTGMTGVYALEVLKPTYVRVMGSQPLPPSAAAEQTGGQATSLTTKPGFYGGAKTADAPTMILPGQPSETTPYPGQPGTQSSPSADEEQAITGNGYDSGYQPVPDPGSSQQDVVFPEVPCPAGTHRPDPTGPCVSLEDKKAMWPWVLGGALVVGVGGYAIYAAGKKKKRRR